MSDAEPEMTAEPSGETSGEPREERPRPKRTGCLVGCLIFLPVAYLLSPVPVILIFLQFEKLGWNAGAEGLRSALEVFFVPINWLYENSELAREFYDWYLGLIDGFAI